MAEVDDYEHPLMKRYWARLNCRFPQVREVFEDCMLAALPVMSREGIDRYLDAASFLGRMGRGAEPILTFLEEWPQVVEVIGEEALPPVMAAIQQMHKSPNGKAILPFLQTLAACVRRLQALDSLQHYLDIALDLMRRTTGSIHGHHATLPSPGLPEFFRQAPVLLAQVSLAGLRNWVEYGIVNHGRHPERQKEYFSLTSPDARAVLQRERHGTLFADVERALDLYLRALWRDAQPLIPYSTAFHELRMLQPYYDATGIRVPDVQEDQPSVMGIDRYRVMLAHMAGHRRWSTPLIADNWSPLQRMAVEFLEDTRIDYLVLRTYPGLRRILLALHPRPLEGECDPEKQSCLRHRLAMLSRACLDDRHNYRDELILDTVTRFHALLANGPSSTAEIATLALSYAARSRRQSDQYADVFFTHTMVEYRDDNRHLWRFIEEGDEEESFKEAPKPYLEEELKGLPPRHYPEWDYRTQSFRPDWVSLYEALHPKGDAAHIDHLLRKHALLAKRLERLLDLLKPQDKVRIRYQEEGSELDLDVALRSLIDYRAGSTPDPRINMSHRTDGRDFAVLLLLDLSESLNKPVPFGQQSILELSQEAVSILAWAIDRLGDPLAIAGFHSNTRHEVRYQHIKGFSECWDDTVKSRLAAMQARWSTRMGAALRHAGHYLGHRRAEKKVLLLLTDGEPADVDCRDDEHYLCADAKKAVEELSAQGIYTFCLSLDPHADEYVSAIFGTRYFVLDHIARLPEKLPQLYLQLTR